MKKLNITRCEQNPIVVPGVYDWRKVSTFNPGVIYEDGIFYMYERSAGSLRPFQTSIGLLKSTDGINFELASDKPVFTAEQLGFPTGSVEDARVVRIDGELLMCYALQPYAFDCWPTGHTLPDYYPEHYPEWKENNTEVMITRSGIATSTDYINFEQLCYTTPVEIDDRDNALFPEKVNGRYAILRRPMQYVGAEYGTDIPGMWISYSDDLINWDKPELVAVAENIEWEGTKIGAAASPVKTKDGWLVLYHGVDKASTYRVGAMLLDLDNPAKVIGRTKNFIMEPETYYEKYGLVIPNTIFPTAIVERDAELMLYYGCCDTNISLATVKTEDLLELLRVK